ncbi:MAG: 50S ribosomal protein L2 [Candidatus Odinarchaeia archaeon]
MGKRILVQRRGRGSRQFRAPTHKRKGKVKYISLSPDEANKTITGEVISLHHDPGRGAPLAYVKFENNKKGLVLAPESLAIGQKITIGPNAPISIGNTLPLKNIPEGTPIFNIEGKPFDGGKFVRSSGGYATLMSIDEEKAVVQLPSGAQKAFNPNCRATIGIVAGGRRPEKPFVKAGKKYHLARAKGWHWPVVRGAAMNAVSHPHGGGMHQSPGGPYTVKRNTPPGAKVGLIAAKRTGRKKRK